MSALEREMAGSTRVTAEPRQRLDDRRGRSAVRAAAQRSFILARSACTAQNFDPNAVQVSTLLSIKTGACPEDCAYCPQSIRYQTGVDTHDLMPLEEVRAAARRAKEAGATRFCMGASYRGPKDSQLEPILAMIADVKALGLETCATLGLLRPGQAERLAAAGLDYYNHNLDSSEEFYSKIISTRTYADRLATLARVRAAGLKVCCGGILGMGETRTDRAMLLQTLATLDPQPESVPINDLVPIAGTPMQGAAPLDPFEFVRCDRSRADLAAALARSPVRGPQRVQRRASGPVLLRRRKFDFLRREAADDRQSRLRGGPAAVRAARYRAGTAGSLSLAAGPMSVSLDSALPERRAARRAFDRAVGFDDACVVHDETRTRLLERLSFFRLEPRVAVDLGCATARGARALADRYPQARVLAVDSSPGMLAAARAACAAAATATAARIAVVGGDAERLPLATGSVQLVLANLVLPWCKPQNLFAEAARVLEAGGLLLFATLGPDSLQEVRRRGGRSTTGCTCMRRSTCTTSAISPSRRGSGNPCSTWTGSS